MKSLFTAITLPPLVEAVAGFITEAFYKFGSGRIWRVCPCFAPLLLWSHCFW